MASTTETVDALTIDEASHHLFQVSPEVNVVHLAFTLLSAFVLVFGMFSALIKERLYAGEAIVATAFGVIFGPYAANLFNPRTWGDPTFDDITLEFTRVVLALSVFAVGVELPKAYVARHFRSLFLIIVPNMLAGWLITGGFIYVLVPGVNFLASLVIAACATPTDPILAASVVGKGKFAQKHVPSHIRHLLQCESGCNDGAAFPFLYLALFLIFRQEHNVGEAIGWWILLVVLYQIILGTLIGAGVGIIARKMLKFAKRRALIDRESMVAMYVSLALFTTAVTTLAGSDDLLAAFACGTAFAWDDWFSESIEDSNFSNIIDLLVNCITFIYIGATMPFSDFNNPVISIYPWRLVLLGIAVLLLRRLPMMLLLYRWMPDIKTFREAVFAGWFGPMGVGAIFISILALTKLPTPAFPPVSSNDYLAYTIQPVVYFLVLCSILVHGTSIPFFNLGRRVHSISRTWTQGSNAEPSWLSRVKRAGQDTNANRSPLDFTEKVRAGPKAERSDLDLEAGEIDDAGMDVGDVSSRDYLNSGGSDDAERVDSTGSGASASDETRVPSKTKRAKDSLSRAKRDLKEEHEEDLRRERHDNDRDQQEWQEGSDIVRESDDGEHVEVEHKGEVGRNKHLRASDAPSSPSRQREAAGPGFPGHRMAEIAQMIERGGEPSHHRHHDKGALARLEAKIRGRDSQESDDDDRSAHHRDNNGDASSEEHGDVYAADAEERLPSRSRVHLNSTSVAHPANVSRPKTREESSSPPRGSAAIRQASVLDRMGLGAQSRLPSYLKVPKSNLTAEEKAARDKLCRKERKDVDDDEVKAWRDGNRLILERNNGEDVEVIELDPDGDTREKAKRDPNLRIRAVDEDAVKAVEGDIKKAKSRLGEASESDQPKRLNLKSMTSFKGFFGQDAERSVQSQSGPSTKANVPAIVREDEEESTPVHQQEPSQSAPNPALLAVRKTGIPLTQTDTTESQIRWGNLPQPKRKR